MPLAIDSETFNFSWHGSQFRTKYSEDGNEWFWIPQTYISVCAKDTTQDATTTFGIVRQNLEMFIKANPNCTSIWLTCDNAANYHCEAFLRLLWSWSSEHGFVLKGVSFAEGMYILHCTNSECTLYMH